METSIASGVPVSGVARHRGRITAVPRFPMHARKPGSFLVEGSGGYVCMYCMYLHVCTCLHVCMYAHACMHVYLHMHLHDVHRTVVGLDGKALVRRISSLDEELPTHALMYTLAECKFS